MYSVGGDPNSHIKKGVYWQMMWKGGIWEFNLWKWGHDGKKKYS